MVAGLTRHWMLRLQAFLAAPPRRPSRRQGERRTAS
jgi:hypothetical protein